MVFYHKCSVTRRSILAGMPAANLNHTVDMIEAEIVHVPGTRKLKDLSGKSFGRLSVLSVVRFKKPSGIRAMWRCLCVCGNIIFAEGSSLSKGRTLSCGCFHRENIGARRRTHGKSTIPEYKIWAQMKQRCRTDVNYLGRGIAVCERWNSFENFINDMGRRPTQKHSIDRIDNDGNYEPGNCRWATRAVQNSNTRRNDLFEINGVLKTAAECSRDLGGAHSLVKDRLRLGWSRTEAFTKPKIR